MFTKKTGLFLFLMLMPAIILSAKGAAAANLPQGWQDGRNYYHWIEKVWDSAVLPSCVPKEIPGVRVEQTIWKMPGHQTINNNNEVGRMSFADSNFEYWGLSFDCNEEQADAFVKALEENGFFGGEIDDYPLTYAYVGNGYYAHVLVRTNYLGSAAEEGYPYGVSFSITPTVHQLPKSFNSWPLPQVGAALEPYGQWSVQFWDDNGDMGEAKWDLQADRGSLPAKNWSAWFDYFGVSNAEAEAYAKTLEAAGWEITYQYPEDESGYSARLRKGDVRARVFFDRRHEMRVGFSDVEEMLDY